MQLVETVASNAKFHSSQNKTNLSTALNVFRNINHRTEEAQVVEDLEAEVKAEEALTEDHEKCTRLHVEIVAKIVKYHSSQNKTNQSTAMIVFKIINQQEIRKRLYYDSKFY